MLFQRKGFLIKDFVAPTNCIVLIKNRFEYIVNLMEELINATAIKLNTKLNSKRI
tara:strand:- start:22 stop:186 length:165 start_codon:yes stop_codon:yes gene_type:complete